MPSRPSSLSPFPPFPLLRLDAMHDFYARHADAPDFTDTDYQLAAYAAALLAGALENGDLLVIADVAVRAPAWGGAGQGIAGFRNWCLTQFVVRR